MGKLVIDYAGQHLKRCIWKSISCFLWPEEYEENPKSRLVTDGKKIEIAKCYFIDFGNYRFEYWCEGGMYTIKPTHWMDLSDLPDVIPEPVLKDIYDHASTSEL